MRFGLRWQLVASLSLLMVATVLLVSFAMLGLTSRSMVAQARHSAERVARIAAGTMGAAIDPRTPLRDERTLADLEHLCALFSREFDATRMTVVATPGETGMEVLASYPARAAETAIDVEILVARAAGEVLSDVAMTPDGVRQVDVFAPIRVDGVVVAVLRVEVPLGEVQRLVGESQQLVLLYLLLDALLIGVAGFWLFTRMIVRPILAVSAATERVAAGDLATTVAVRSTNEIGQLARNFDRMVGRLREGRDALERRLDELARSKEALEQAQEELVFSEKMATVGGLAAGVAHEIGNPLAAVTGLLELLRDRDGLDEADVDDLLGRVDREIARINTIIAGLLDYARVSDAAPEPVDIATPIAAARSLVGHHPRGRGIVVEASGSGDGIVRAAENPLVQVFLNLLLNAADAMGGAGTVRVDWCSATSEGVAGVLVRVSDEGPGIPGDLMPQIFEPFITTKGGREGTGLGLAMSARIVARYRGRIWAESPDGGGAVFHVWLPSASVGDSTAADSASPQMPSGK